MVSALLPYLYILCLGFGLLVVTLVSGALQVMGEESVRLLGREWSLRGVSGLLLYLLGLVGEVFLLTSLYMVMPVGRLSWRHALIGGVTAAFLWEITRHILVWYFATLSQVNVVYGSLDGDRRAAQPGDRGGAVAAWGAGDFGVRAHRPAGAAGARQSAAGGQARNPAG
jgi:YihY family inner membrane protein